MGIFCIAVVASTGGSMTERKIVASAGRGGCGSCFGGGSFSSVGDGGRVVERVVDGVVTVARHDGDGDGLRRRVRSRLGHGCCKLLLLASQE